MFFFFFFFFLLSFFFFFFFFLSFFFFFFFCKLAEGELFPPHSSPKASRKLAAGVSPIAYLPISLARRRRAENSLLFSPIAAQQNYPILARCKLYLPTLVCKSLDFAINTCMANYLRGPKARSMQGLSSEA